MPELPEVESARAAIDRAALGRLITGVDDSDSYECRPHRPGEIRAAILGRTLTAVHRQGKSIWCDTSGIADGDPPGPALGIHLGMSGKIVIADGHGAEIDGGDYWARGRTAADARFARFSLTFADGGSLRLIDPRRLGRVRLNPPVERLGPDAQQISAAQFRAVLAKGTAPVKARLLDQDSIAGLGNLLVDQILWQAGRRADPGRGRPTAPGAPPGHQGGAGRRRRAHAADDPVPDRRRPLPALRRSDGPRHSRRADDLVVPPRAVTTPVVAGARSRAHPHAGDAAAGGHGSGPREAGALGGGRPRRPAPAAAITPAACLSW